MWKFTTLYHPLRHELGITVSEYIYLDYLAHTQAEPQNKHGNTEALQAIADKLEVSKRHVINMNEKLVSLGLLEIMGNQKQVTQVWFDGLKMQRGEKIAPPKMVKKVHHDGEKSSPNLVKKVHHHIKDIDNIDNILVREYSVSNETKKPLSENQENRFIEQVQESYWFKQTENLNTKKQPKRATKQSDVITLDNLEIPQGLSDVRLLNLYEKFMREPKQRKKSIGAHNLTLQKLERFDIEFAIELVEAAMCSNYQGVVFPDTAAKYAEWKKKRKGAQANETLMERAMRAGRETVGYKGINFDDLDFTNNG